MARTYDPEYFPLRIKWICKPCSDFMLVRRIRNMIYTICSKITATPDFKAEILELAPSHTIVTN